MSIKYYDIVPKSEKGGDAEELRRALARAGFEPVGEGGFRWRSAADGDKFDIYLMTFREPCLMYSNTRTLKIRCPFCLRPIDAADWHRAVMRWRETGEDMVVPCCGQRAALRQLIYDPPVYFTRAAVTLCARDDSASPRAVVERLSSAAGLPLDCIERIC